MGILDYGQPGAPLGSPSLSSWAAAVKTALNSRDETVDSRISKGAPWTAFVPTTTGAVYSNVKAWYALGAVVHVLIKATVTSVSGDISFSLPYQAHADAVGTAIGNARLICNGSNYFAHVYLGGTFTATVRSPGTLGVATAISPTSPNTWKAADQVGFHAIYLAV